MNYSQYIKDKSQTDLSMQQLTEKEKLIKYREILYNDLINKIKELDIKRIYLIKEYQAKLKEIDEQIKRL